MGILIKTFFIDPLMMIFKPREASYRRVKYLSKQQGADAIAKDWENVGNDIRKAIGVYEEEQSCQQMRQ